MPHEQVTNGGSPPLASPQSAVSPHELLMGGAPSALPAGCTHSKHGPTSAGGYGFSYMYFHFISGFHFSVSITHTQIVTDQGREETQGCCGGQAGCQQGEAE